MKRILMLCFVFLFLAAAAAHAHVVSFNPLYALFNYKVIDYEMPIYGGMGLEFSGSGYGYNTSDWAYSVYGLAIMPKFYFNGTAPSGPWWGPALRYSDVRVEYRPSKKSANVYTMGGGLLTGYRWIFGKDAKEGFVLELGVGYLVMGLPDIEVDGETFQSQGNVSGVIIKFDIGWAF
jgi:hypothetical protein